MKVYIGRDKISDMDRICISTREITYLKSKHISQPQHSHSRWNFILTDDFNYIMELCKEKNERSVYSKSRMYLSNRNG